MLNFASSPLGNRFGCPAVSSEPQAHSSHFLILDALRGVACLAVVFAHVYGSMRKKGLLSGPPFLDILANQGHLGVQVFFVLSGYCIAAAACSGCRRGEGVLAFARRRIRRIWPPYLFVLPIYLIVNQVAHVMQSAGRMKIGDVQYLDVFHQPIGFYLSNLFLVSEPFHQKLLFGAAWSLDYEVAFYAIFGLALVCWNEPRRLLLAAHGLSLVTLLTCLGGISLPFPLNLWPQFGLGVVAYDIVTGISPQWIRTVSQLSIPLAAGIGILEICRGFVAPVAHERPSTWIVTAAFAFYLIWALPRQSSAPKADLTRRLASSGAYSYSTYLLHQAILPVLQVGFLKLRVGGSVGILALFMSIGLILQISKSYSRLCETPFKTSASRQPTEFDLPQPAQT